MKQYILTGESAKKFMEIKNNNEEKLKERINSMRINLKDGSFVEMNDDGFWSGYDDVMGEISAEELVTQILEVGVLDSVHENNNAKIKVNRAVANFIDDYARNMTHNENWKNKLLMDHAVTYSRGFDGESERVRVMKDITPMQLAEILRNGYEAEKYTVENLPKMFKFVFSGYDVEHTSIICEDKAYVAYEYEGEFLTSIIVLSDMLSFLNGGVWAIIK